MPPSLTEPPATPKCPQAISFEESSSLDKVEKVLSEDMSVEMSLVISEPSLQSDITAMDLEDEEVDSLLLDLLQYSMVWRSRPSSTSGVKEVYDPLKRIRLPARCNEPPKIYVRRT